MWKVILRPMAKTYVFFLTSDNRLKRIKLPARKITFGSKKPVEDQTVFFNGKAYTFHSAPYVYGRHRAILFKENQLFPLLLAAPDDAQKQAHLTAIIRDHTVREFLNAARVSYLAYLGVGFSTLLLGVIIGIILYPHLVVPVK